jgi:hypothetical protein
VAEFGEELKGSEGTRGEEWVVGRLAVDGCWTSPPVWIACACEGEVEVRSMGGDGCAEFGGMRVWLKRRASGCDGESVDERVLDDGSEVEVSGGDVQSSDRLRKKYGP